MGTIVTDEPLKGYGETCGETEATNTSREDFILILLALATEETFAGYSYDLQTNTILRRRAAPSTSVDTSLPFAMSTTSGFSSRSTM